MPRIETIDRPRNPEMDSFFRDKKLLVMAPDFLFLHLLMLAGQLAKDGSYNPDSFSLEHFSAGIEHIDKNPNSRISSGIETTANSYSNVIHTITETIGLDKVLLVKTRYKKNLSESQKKILEAVRKFGNNLGGPLSKVAIITSEIEAAFVRDFFTTTDDVTFGSGILFKGVKETKNFKLSPLGEGGTVLNCGNVIILNQATSARPDSDKYLKELRKRGYRVNALPAPLPSLQPPEKRSFVSTHIDGHCNLFRRPDGKIVFIYAKSYANQNQATRNIIDSLPETTGVVNIEVDDRDLPLLAFNFLALENGYVFSPKTGIYNDEGEYIPSNLDRILASELGDKYIQLPSLGVIPHLTKAGLRCMTNIVSDTSLNYLRHQRAIISI